MSITQVSGGHVLPERFTGLASVPSDAAPATPGRAPRRRRTGLWVGLAVTACVGAGAGGTHLWANVAYDDAAAGFATAAAALHSAHDELTDTVTESRTASEAITALQHADAGLLTSAEARDALTAAIDAAAAEVAEAAAAASDPLPQPPVKPDWPWELFGGAEQLTEDAAAAEVRTDALLEAAEDTELQTEVLATTADDLLTAAAEAVPDFEHAHLAARNAAVIELRQARDEVAERASVSDAASADAFARLNEAASAVVASHAEVMADKSGPLLSRRLQVEEYARSIAGGVLLDFEWRQIVNGRGLGGSAGGLATWNSGHGGYSTITLSNSVAERWPSAVMKALVTHEVGHAISAKCYEMFDWQDRDANEQWATAWALSLGHTADGNGVSLYGYPPQSLIDTAATCR